MTTQELIFFDLDRLVGNLSNVMGGARLSLSGLVEDERYDGSFRRHLHERMELLLQGSRKIEYVDQHRAATIGDIHLACGVLHPGQSDIEYEQVTIDLRKIKVRDRVIPASRIYLSGHSDFLSEASLKRTDYLTAWNIPLWRTDLTKFIPTEWIWRH